MYDFVNAKDAYGYYVIYYACENGHLPIVKYLISKDVNINAKDEYGEHYSLCINKWFSSNCSIFY